MQKRNIRISPIAIILISFLSINHSFSQEVKSDSTILKPTEEVIPSVNGDSIKIRLERLQNEVPLKYNQYVHSFVDFFTYRKPSFTKTMLERRNYFFPIFEENLKKYNIPDEIKYLSLIESGLNPKAISHAGAAGLWQFMPKTGRIDFGLRIDKFVDERLHVQKSTEAACKYMRQLYRIFDDWELVLAAYNTGPGNVRRAIRKAGGGGFWNIYPYLPKETRSYVPQYVAMIYMINHASDYNILPEYNEFIPQSSPIMVSNYLNLSTLATLSHIPFEELQLVNPHILTNELPDYTKDFILEIPTNCYSFFDENRVAILDSASKRILAKGKGVLSKPSIADTSLLAAETKKMPKKSVTPDDDENSESRGLAENDADEFEEVAKRKPTIKYHVIKRGENLNQIANKYGVDVYDIKSWNKIKKANSIKYGQKIKLYLENGPIKAEYFAKNAKTLELKKAESKTKLAAETKKTGKSKTHTIKKGENLIQIATQYNVDVEDIKEWNNIKKENKIQSGQKLKLYGISQKRQLALNDDEEETDSKIIKPKFHIVNKGDTIWSIAQRYEGSSVDKIRKLNDIRDNNLKPGQKLRVS
jgi:membrane-bound lytic murein transglycosylase D